MLLWRLIHVTDFNYHLYGSHIDIANAYLIVQGTEQGYALGNDA